MIDLKTLDAKSILGDEIFLEIVEEKDPIQQARLTLTFEDMAKEFGVKQQFEKMLKSFVRAKKSYNRNTGGSYTDFDGDYPRLYTGGWNAGEDGINILTQFGERVACSHPIMPVKTLVNAETGYHKVIIVFKTRGRWKEVIVDKEDISSNNRILKLSKYGVKVTSENARALVQYLTDVESMNESVIKEQVSTSKLGWLNKWFIPYDENVLFDNDDSLSGAFKSVTSYGSYNKWLELMRKIRSASRIEPNMYLAASFASPLLHKLNALPFIFSLCGTTGKGKTVLLMAATSIWADPTEGKYFIKAKANEIALEVRLDFLNHLPMAVDDLSQIQSRVKNDFSEFIYNICSGGGKERSNVNIGLQRQRYWKNIILTNSERSLISETMQGGAINRIIELEAEEGYIFENGAAVVDLIKENYGHAGREFIGIIKDMEISEIKGIQQGFLNKLNEKSRITGIEKEEKQLIPMSILLTADKLAADHIFEDGKYLDFDACFSILKSKNEVSEEERAYDYIMSEIQIHRNNFIPDDRGIYKGEVWGAVEKGYAAIHNNIFNDMCRDGNFSAQGFLKWAERNGLLLKGNDGKNSKNTKIGGKQKRCIHLKMDEEENTDFATEEEYRKTLENQQEELPFM